MATRKPGMQLPNTGTFTESLGSGGALFGGVQRAAQTAAAVAEGEGVGDGDGVGSGRAGGGDMLDYYLDPDQRDAIDDFQQEEKDKGYDPNRVPTIPESTTKREYDTTDTLTPEAFKHVPLDIAQYESMREQIAAMNRLGVKSPAAEKELARIAKRLRESQLQLADQLGNIKEGEWQAFADNVNELYGIDAAEIQRSKEFLLKDLGLRNTQRDAQQEFLQSKFGIVDERLDQALAETRIRREEGQSANVWNKKQLDNNAAARGAWMSQGNWDAKAREDETLAELMSHMDEADRGSRTTAKEDRGEIQFQIEDIDREEAADILRWREDNAGMDSKKGRLDSDRKKNYADYLYGLAAEREKAAERERERQLRAQEYAAQIRNLNAAHAASLAQAEAAASAEAWQRWHQMEASNHAQQFSNWQANGTNATPSDAQYLSWIQQGGFPGHDAPDHILGVWRQFQANKFNNANTGVNNPSYSGYGWTR